MSYVIVRSRPSERGYYWAEGNKWGVDPDEAQRLDFDAAQAKVQHMRRGNLLSAYIIVPSLDD